MDPSTSSNSTGKEKKTRRRLRLSCVECTKRRQKCDRKHPCGLCVSRKVPHLCHFSAVPVARPPPQQSPHVSSQLDKSQELYSRIAELERLLRIEQTKNERRNPSYQSSSSENAPASSVGGSSPLPSLIFPELSPPQSDAALHSPSGQRSLYSSPEPLPQEEDFDPLPLTTPLDANVVQTVCTAYLLTLAAPGEYVGRGSATDALRWVSQSDSTGVQSLAAGEALFINSTAQSMMSPNYSTHVQHLLNDLPSMGTASSFVFAYFTDINWRFGLPERWFRTMFNDTYMNFRAQFNPNWLALLFAVFGCAPRDSLTVVDGILETSDLYFSCVETALRAAEASFFQRTDFSGTSSSVSGALLGCLAVPLYSGYLADRGRLSEAWQIVGRWIRIGEAIGLHREADVQDDDEKLARRRAWNNLTVCDRTCSFLLGRTSLTSATAQDTQVVVSSGNGGHSAPDTFSTYQNALMQLCNIASDVADKCFGQDTLNASTIRDLDTRFEQWEARLPLEFSIKRRRESSPPRRGSMDNDSTFAINRQRYIITMYYLLFRMKLHLTFLAHNDISHHFLGLFRPALTRKQSRTTCITLAMDLIRLQSNIHNDAGRLRTGQIPRLASAFVGKEFSFERYWTLMDASIVLISVLMQHHWQDRPADAEGLVEHTLQIFSALSQEGQDTQLTNLSHYAMATLSPLFNQPGWRSHANTRSPSSTLGRLAIHPAASEPIGATSFHSSLGTTSLDSSWSSNVTLTPTAPHPETSSTPYSFHDSRHSTPHFYSAPYMSYDTLDTAQGDVGRSTGFAPRSSSY